ncbi:MAG: phosphatase PAP2 family protein [Clostridia bacterium]
MSLQHGLPPSSAATAKRLTAAAISNYIKENTQIFYFFGFLINGVWYFLLQAYIKNAHVVHTIIDDYIPFVPIFAIPYVIWYAYVVIPMIYLCFKDKKAFKKQCIILFGGMYISLFIFTIFPTQILSRPIISNGANIFENIVGLIYSNDGLINACPSLHCYESIVIHFSMFKSEKLANKKILRVCSFALVILICLSTVFIKQHSVVDIVAAIALAVVMYFLVYGKKKVT